MLHRNSVPQWSDFQGHKSSLSAHFKRKSSRTLLVQASLSQNLRSRYFEWSLRRLQTLLRSRSLQLQLLIQIARRTWSLTLLSDVFSYVKVCLNLCQNLILQEFFQILRDKDSSWPKLRTGFLDPLLLTLCHHQSLAYTFHTYQRELRPDSLECRWRARVSLT